jgi:hypothetical protein
VLQVLVLQGLMIVQHFGPKMCIQRRPACQNGFLLTSKTKATPEFDDLLAFFNVSRAVMFPELRNTG